MAVTLRASKLGLQIIDQKRKEKGWYKRQGAWYLKADSSEGTLRRFWRGLPIDRDTFIKICQAVGIENWAEIVDNSPISPTASYLEFSVYDEQIWVGRDVLISDLTAKLHDKCRILLLVGITGIGKTALGEKLVEELRGNWKEHRKNFEDNHKASDFASVATEWLEQWGENIATEERTPEQLLGRLVKRLCENQYLILLDSLEYLLTGNEEDGWGDFADRWWGRFFVSLLAEPSCQSRLILTSQDFPVQLERELDLYDRLWEHQLLRGLETSEQISFFQRAELDDDLESSSSPLRIIGEVYDGHPLALRVIAGEIKEDWHSNVKAYWKENKSYIEEVKKALDEARQEGIVRGESDRWQLDSYTKRLRRKVKERLEKTFQRLKNDVPDAYLLLCTASVYRCEVPESWWLEHLECRGYSQEKQELAMSALRDRFLVEEAGINDEDELLVGQHNLIRSLAIAHRLNLFGETSITTETSP